ncbi:NUMOD4 domain-containing protein [Priestia megaterium]|uniref:NUMOD4 domain-containing protein n=1 Tax=Priestia megaterium TaxID=1404 RepID=UPI0032D92A89
MAIYKNLDLRDIPGEQWKQFHEGKRKLFYVSNLGRIKTVAKSTGKQQIRKQRVSKGGYLTVNIIENKPLSIHRVVAETWIPNPHNHSVVCHENNIKTHNTVYNLRWDTQLSNVRQAHDDGLMNNKQEVVSLTTNGELITQHESLAESLSAYEGKYIKFNKDLYAKGNVILMKLADYEELTDNELFAIVSDCFERMLKHMYAVNGQLVDGTNQTAKMIGISKTHLNRITKDNQPVECNGYSVSRLKNMIGVSV